MSRQRNVKDKKHLSLIGQRFGKLKVIKEDTKGQKKRSYWVCECDCGNIVVIRGTALTSGNTKSCGCISKENREKRNFIDLSGESFGLLKVTNEYKLENRKRLWKCICDCGNTCWISTDKLKSGHTKSCGCIRSSFGEEYISKLLISNSISFIREYSFNNLRFDSGKLARFDFAVFNEQNQLTHLIEYDGIQHYKYSNNGWCTQEVYEKAKKHDSIKNEFCFNNNIVLIRIPYFVLDGITINDLLIGSKYTL